MSSRCTYTRPQKGYASSCTRFHVSFFMRFFTTLNDVTPSTTSSANSANASASATATLVCGSPVERLAAYEER